MLRAGVVLLLLANLFFFGWARGWFAPGWPPPRSAEREPGRLVAQVRPDYEPGLVFIDVLTDNAKNLPFVRQVGIQAIPTTYFLDKSGSGTRYIGAMKEPDLRAQLTALVDGS